jgi:hypothetical protein
MALLLRAAGAKRVAAVYSTALAITPHLGDRADKARGGRRRWSAERGAMPGTSSPMLQILIRGLVPQLVLRPSLRRGPDCMDHASPNSGMMSRPDLGRSQVWNFGGHVAGTAEKPGCRVLAMTRETMEKRRGHVALIEEMRSAAQSLGISFDEVLDQAGLSRSSRSRLYNGTAGPETILKVRSAFSAATKSKNTLPDHTQVAVAYRSREVDAASRRKRWVVVEGKHRQLVCGQTDAPDSQIAAEGYVRLDNCAWISGTERNAAMIAVQGPQGDSVGAVAPSVLVLDVSMVLDCSDVASRALAAVVKAV